MRVLQLIDSLDAGGAERVAVTYANTLCDYVDESFLCTTRKEGLLKHTIDKKVGYISLKKNSALDIKAIVRLVSFIKKNRVNIIHAHTSSFFLATSIKLYLPKIMIIWHDHYGKSEELDERDYKILKWCSSKFCAIISVNRLLEEWAKKNLKTKNVYYLENTATIPLKEMNSVKLFGQKGKRIVCIANMRPQKDHINLLKAFKLVLKEHPEYTLHLIGQHWDDAYYKNIMDLMNQNTLKEKVHYYGSQSNIISILKQCDMGVLSSKSEGLPLAMLEYGLARLGVVCTDVGQCKELVLPYGKCVSPNAPRELAAAICFYIENKKELSNNAQDFQNHIHENYNINTIIPKLVSYYEACN